VDIKKVMRWPQLRKIISNPLLFQLFNLTFIAFYQNVLIFAFTLPAYIAWRARDSPLNAIDLLAAGIHLTLIIGETIADQQQWLFQNEKYRQIAAKEELFDDYKNGFLTSGLFRYSRHPNFFCEISLWFAFYLYSVGASGVWLNWSITGAVLLMLLFQGSTNFTEKITKAKYPQYAFYQQTTSRLIPFFPHYKVE